MQPIPLDHSLLAGWVLFGLELWHLEMCCARALFLYKGIGREGLPPGNRMSSCEHWGFSVSAPTKSRDHSKCHTLEHKGYVSHGTEIQPPCSGTDTWEENEPGFEDKCWINSGWHSSPWALQHDLQLWLALLSHGRKGSPGERVSGTSWKSAPAPGCGREAVLK